METTEMKKPQVHQPLSEEAFDRSFKPHGAIAFFTLLVLLGAAIWYGIYFIMLQRA